jgi:ribonuclease R
LNQLFFTFSPLVKSQRLQRGSFNIQSDTQLPFLDEGRSGVILVSDDLPIRALLTELIVLMGKAIADHLVALQVPSIFCTQSAPDWEDLTDLLKLAANLKLEVTVDTEADLKPQDYANLTQAFAKSESSRILNHLIEGTLKGEKYSTHPAPHFGLAYSDAYTHFISPGQRYADLLIQRVLKLVLSEGRDRRTKQTKVGVTLNNRDCHGQINWNVLPPAIHEALIEDFHLLMSPLNDRVKIAEDAEKDLTGLKKSEKMKERTGQIFRGLITGVQSYGFFVEIEDLLVEGLVHVSSLKDDWYEYRARHSCLVGRKNRTAYRLGNEVDVQIKSVDYYRQQIDLITVSSGVASQNSDWDDE